MKTFKLIGRRYSTEPTYYDFDKNHEWPNYKELEEVNLGVHKFNDIHEAEKFIITNYPELYFGCNIVGVDNTDFCCNAHVGYYESEFKTNNRKYIINELLKSPRFA